MKLASPTRRFAVVAPLALGASLLFVGLALGVELNVAATTPPRGAGAPIVGAYYYPWYGSRGDEESQWRNVFRQRLDPPEAPAAGLYRSDDAAVIKQHIEQSVQGGLAFWAVSWWGPGSPTDRIFREALLTHPDADKLRYAVLYESTGRLGSDESSAKANWTSDLAYLEEHYFRDPRYLRIDGRPVLFVYLTRVYFRDKGAEALAAGRAAVKDLYLVGDDVFGERYEPEWAKQFDAVTAYDVYGQSTGIHGSTRKAVKQLADNYANARKVAQGAGAAFIPCVAPGYNDTVIRTGHPGSARYFVEDPSSKEGDLFRGLIQEAALPNLDERAGRMMMVTSFNEWFEDSQIEATTGKAQGRAPTTLRIAASLQAVVVTKTTARYTSTSCAKRPAATPRQLPDRSSNSRKSRQCDGMKFQDDNRVVLTLDAGGTNFVFSAMRGGEEVAPAVRLPSAANDLPQSLKNLVTGFEQAAAAITQAPAAISFAFPGPADYPAGVISNVGNLPAYAGGVPLGAILENHFRIPVFINNDGDLFAYGEAVAGLLPEINALLESAGSPKRYKNLFGVTLGTGFGGGIVRNGELFIGDNSNAGEIWLMRNKVRPTAFAEEGASIRAVQRSYAEAAGIPLAEAPSPKEIAEIARDAGNVRQQAAAGAFRTLGEAVGDALANSLTLIDGLAVIGGGLAGAHALFMPALIDEMNGTIAKYDGGTVARLGAKVFNLSDEKARGEFVAGDPRTVAVPGTDKQVTYDATKRLGVGISKLGAERAIALGAYLFALNELDKQ